MSSVISEILCSEHCEDCALSRTRNHILVRNETIGINQKYAREKINLLFVAKSPPMAFLKDQSRYFYASGQIKRRGLFYHMMSVLFKGKMKMHSKYSKEYFLRKFRSEGRFYLTDMVSVLSTNSPKKKKKGNRIVFKIPQCRIELIRLSKSCLGNFSCWFQNLFQVGTAEVILLCCFRKQRENKR